MSRTSFEPAPMSYNLFLKEQINQEHFINPASGHTLSPRAARIAWHINRNSPFPGVKPAGEMTGQFWKACLIEILLKKLLICAMETIREGKYENNASRVAEIQKTWK